MQPKHNKNNKIINIIKIKRELKKIKRFELPSKRMQQSPRNVDNDTKV
jgi:hypothetical protein